MLFDRFHLNGCRLEVAQTWGSIRMVAIVRDRVREDLRLASQSFPRHRVNSTYRKADFTSYMPQAFVVNWNRDGTGTATAETHLGEHGHLTFGKLWKRTGPSQLAFLPNALAIEGFMVRHFKGPDVAWLDYRREVRRGSLGYRAERMAPGWILKGLSEALSVFEFVPGQVGMALFVDEELSGCFLTPHPDDYARLHETLLTDQYADHLIHYGFLRYAKNPELALHLPAVIDLDSLAVEFARVTSAERDMERYRLTEIEGRALDAQTVYRTGVFSLQRFVTRLGEADNFAGEAILRQDGTLEYLKLFRLSRGQTRRLRLLSTLAQHGWDFERAAPDLNLQTREDVARSFVEADLGYLLNPGMWGHLISSRELDWV